MTRKQKIAGLLKRYEFIDFAKAVAVDRAKRKEHLRTYIDRSSSGRWRSYKGLRALTPDIVGVARALDPSDVGDWATIERGLKRICHEDDFGFNCDAAKHLFDFVREQPIAAYADHPRGSLRIGPDRTIPMGVDHYVIDGERGAFRYVFPRQERLLGDIPNILLSLIFHNYVQGDFDEFEVEMIDLSCAPPVKGAGGAFLPKVRAPHIVQLKREDLLSREKLNAEADHIYGLLMEISEEG